MVVFEIALQVECRDNSQISSHNHVTEKMLSDNDPTGHDHQGYEDIEKEIAGFNEIEGRRECRDGIGVPRREGENTGG